MPTNLDSVAVGPETVVARLRWRYATKKFDAARRIGDAEWAALEQSLLLAPSSYGLQPWKFLVIEDRALREGLMAASWNQRQVVDASHYVVVAARRALAASDVERHVARIGEVRAVPRDSLAKFERAMKSFVAAPPAHVALDDWAARQAYIALGFAMEAAAMLGIDTCPIEGLDPAAYDALLGLPARGYFTVCALALGHRAADDRNATLAKVRFPLDEVVEHVA